MSGSRYFSESNSSLSVIRVALEPTEGSPEGLKRVIKESEAAGLPDELIAPLREKLVELTRENQLTNKEVEIIKSYIDATDLSYYGVKVNNTGIYFDDGEEGNLYSPEESFWQIFDAVRNTVRFSGVIEIHGSTIDEYTRIEVEDSIITAVRPAEVKWK